MKNLIEYDLGFNNKEKQKINKIYNQGDIIISYPGPDNEINQINITKSLYNENKIKPKSKSIATNKKLTNRSAGYKTMKQQVEEMYNEIQKEIDQMDGDEDAKKNIGYILRDAFTNEELLKDEKFGPNPLINLENYLNPKTNKKIIKPYIPDLQTYNKKINNNNKKSKDKKIKPYMKNNYINSQEKPKEVNLQKIIDIWRENEKIVQNIHLLYNRFLREEKIREENKKKKELLKELKKKSKSKNKSKEKNGPNMEENIKINNESKIIKENNNENRVNNEGEDEKDKYITIEINDRKKEEEKFAKTSNTIKKNCINDKKDFIKIVDISKDQKYIEAKKYIKKSKENCDKANDMVLEINHKIREDKKSIGNSDYKVVKKPREELENKLNQIIENVKTGINFSLNYENYESKINKWMKIFW